MRGTYIRSSNNTYYKFISNVLIQNCRTCWSTSHSAAMTCQFSLALRKSKVLHNLSKQVFTELKFDPNAGLIELISKKSIKSKESLTVNNIARCLQDLHQFNLLYTHIENLKNIQFDYSNQSHCILLDMVCTNICICVSEHCIQS